MRLAPGGLVLALLAAGCAPAGLSSGVPRATIFGEVGFEEARRICEAEDAFWEAHLPARERVELSYEDPPAACERARRDCPLIFPPRAADVRAR